MDKKNYKPLEMNQAIIFDEIVAVAKKWWETTGAETLTMTVTKNANGKFFTCRAYDYTDDQNAKSCDYVYKQVDDIDCV